MEARIAVTTVFATTEIRIEILECSVPEVNKGTATGTTMAATKEVGMETKLKITMGAGDQVDTATEETQEQAKTVETALETSATILVTQIAPSKRYKE